MTAKVSQSACKKKLAYLWFLGSAVLFAIVFIQTIGGRYQGNTSDAWGWFLPNVIPTLSLMIGVFAWDAKAEHEDKSVDSFIFRLSFSLSLAYILVIFLTIMALPFVITDELSAMAFLQTSKSWLVPLQGMATLTLGIFFVKSQ